MPDFQNKANLWVPPSVTHREAAAVAVAVRDYDPDLSFGRNETTGQWCIFLRQGTSEATKEADLPIMGFNEIPHPNDAMRRLHQADALRTGREILDNLERVNRDIRKGTELKADAAVEEAAEAFDWGFRQMGKAPHTKVFINRED